VPKPTCSVDGCNNESINFRGWCSKHYQRWLHYRDPLGHFQRTSVIDRYWSHVDQSNGLDACWPWTSVRNAGGYGTFGEKGRTYLAHRWGYAHRVGPIPDGHGVLHRCDNPPCQNDRHWFTGTDADNAADRVAKGRGGSRKIAGEAHWTTRLTADQVLSIRSRYAQGGILQRELGAEFGITKNSVSMIVCRNTWRHI
jgi:hypothetical protein